MTALPCVSSVGVLIGRYSGVKPFNRDWFDFPVVSVAPSRRRQIEFWLARRFTTESMSEKSTSTSSLSGGSQLTWWQRAVRPGLQLKFTCLVVGLALAVGVVVGSVTTDYATLIVRRIQTDHCRQEAALLAYRAADEYEFGPKSLKTLGSRFMRTKSLLFVSFMDAQGRTIASVEGQRHSHNRALTEGFTPGTTIGQPLRLSRSDRDEDYLDVTFPIQNLSLDEGDRDASPDVTSSERLIGYVRIGYSLEQTLAEVEAASELLSGIAILIVCLTVPLAYLLVIRLLRPLAALTDSISRFADGDLNARCQVGAGDEIGELAIAYNAMADRLQQKHLEITELNSYLEQRVQERTRQLQELASRDPLTGLYNRRHFNEVMTRRFAESQRYGSSLACVMIDLDDFKVVNDTHGHQRGDDILKLAATTVEQELRSSDVAARFGGDEFVVLMPQAEAKQARGFSQRIQQRFAEVVAIQYPHCPVTISVGTASLSDVTSNNPDELVRLADLSLYDSKRDGKKPLVQGAHPAV
jgi:diguanylate cyclase (GGDEF)-like protein